MITEIPRTSDDNNVRGWIFYDAECPMCVLGRNRVGRLFEARNWVWIPLQTPGTARRLNCSETELLLAMTVQLNTGMVLGGVAAWSALLRSVWWLSPFGVVLTIPMIRQLADFGYGWVARNRHCLSRVCGTRKGNQP